MQWVLGNTDNSKNKIIISAIGDINKKFADHMFHKNSIVEAFALSSYGTTSVLEAPMCGHCEQPAWQHTLKDWQKPFEDKFDEFGTLIERKFTYNAWCPRCGKETINTILLKDYLISELKLSDNELVLLHDAIKRGEQSESDRQNKGGE